MTANKSYLSSSKYGYDFVVATTQASINSGLKEYLNTINQPTTTLCFLADSKGNPSVPITLDALKAKTGGSIPSRYRVVLRIVIPALRRSHKTSLWWV